MTYRLTKCKKRKLATTKKETELDLEKIMDESDALPDLVQNRQVLNGDDLCLSDNSEPPISRLSLVTLDTEPKNNNQIGIGGPPAERV